MKLLPCWGGQRLHGMRNGREKLREFHNGAIDDAIMVFEDFKRPQSEQGAMAYDPDGDHIVHIGSYPRHADGDSKQRKRESHHRHLALIEDATIIYMLVRAPERLVFNIDTGH